MNSSEWIVECKKCGKSFKTNLDFLGTKHLNCPNCNHPIMIEQHGGHCWKYEGDDYDSDNPCSGRMNVSEDYPGMYTYFCDEHGHFEDLYEGGE